MSLSDEELERYARHIVLREFGGPGQQALKTAKVLVVGAGGLGAPVLLYLAAAGVGTLGIVDSDTVSLSNLQRQVIHSTQGARERALKTESARSRLHDLNPNVTVEVHSTRLTAENALAIIAGYDIVADGTDNFATRYLVSDACYLEKKTLVTAAVGQFDLQMSTFKPHQKRDDGTPYPTYRCLHREAPPEELVLSCEDAGILGALTGIAGSMQAMEVIKEISGVGEGLAGRLLMYDALAARFMSAAIPWDPDNPLNGRNPTIVDLRAHA